MGFKGGEIVSKRILVSLVVGVGLAAQSLGCGDNDEATAISKANYISNGNRICAKTVEKQTAAYGQIGEEAKGQLTPSEGQELEAKFVEEVAATVDTMIDELEELGTPAGKEEAATEMLDEYAKGAEEAESEPKVFLSGKAFVAADQIAGELGLTKCEGM